MRHLSWIVLASLVCTHAFGVVSFEEQVARVEELEKLQSSLPISVDIDAYKRELEYEKLDLPSSKRAQQEMDLLADKIRNQVITAYQASLNEHMDSERATLEIKSAIKKDLELASPEMREELMSLAMNTLQSLQNGGTSHPVKMEKVQAALLKKTEERSKFLNDEKVNSPLPVADASKDSERKEYNSKSELIESLVSDRTSTRWVNTSNMTARTIKVKSRSSKISLQVKFDFLGISVEAGPSITFSREFSTSAWIMAEGLNPVILPDGNFDFYKRDAAGKVVMKNGKPVKRFASLTCDAELNFTSEYAGAGGFKIEGAGTDVSFSQKFSNDVTLSSRRVVLPEYIEGKTVTQKLVSEICHNDFLNARYSNNMTVAGSLQLMMKNMVSSLSFSHPKTKCAEDSHCFDWYNNRVLGLWRANNYPRCVEESAREKYRACALRGLEGQKCAVIKNGVRISDGSFEFTCDVGLKCVQTRTGGWFKGGELYEYPEGKCMPINRRTYVSPF